MSFNPQDYNQQLQLQQQFEFENQKQIFKLINSTVNKCFNECISSVDNVDLSSTEHECLKSCTKKTLSVWKQVSDNFGKMMMNMQQQ